MHQWIRAFVVVVCVAGLAACASVTVKKVPTPTQYGEAWTDKMQAEADAMEGTRFYLPRPYVNVFQSFPVATDVYFVNGVVAPDGNSVVITNVRKDSKLIKLFASQLDEEKLVVEVPSQYLRVIESKAAKQGGGAPPSVTLQSAVEDAVEAVKEAGEKAAAESNDGSDDTKPAAPDGTGKPPEKTGTSSHAVTNDNGAFAVQPLRGDFDIVYLPDFEEQYVVTTTAGLGNAESTVNLGQGWSLQGFNATVDNSKGTALLFDLIETTMAAAKTAAGAYIPGLGAAAGSSGVKLQSVADDDEGAKGLRQIAASPVMLRIVVVHYAAKGLYPILKPREFAQLTDTSKTFDAGRATTPLHPYQHISFNTFSYVGVEVLTRNGTPFDSLYDPDGVAGAGDGTSAPRPPSTGGGNGGANTGGGGKKVTADEIKAEVRTTLTSAFPGRTFKTSVKKEDPVSIGVRLQLPASEKLTVEQRSDIRNKIRGLKSSYQTATFVSILPLADDTLTALVETFNTDNSGLTLTVKRIQNANYEYTLVKETGGAAAERAAEGKTPDDKWLDAWKSAWKQDGGSGDDAAGLMMKKS